MQITTAVSSSEFDWFTSCRAIDAMVMFNTPFRGQQELSLLGAEQTTSLLVVMIVIRHSSQIKPLKNGKIALTAAQNSTIMFRTMEITS